MAVYPEEMELDDGQVVAANEMQRWLLDRWREYWEAVERMASSYGAEVIAILNGELADDNKHTKTELMSKNPNDQARASLRVLEDVQAVADRIYVTRGTEAHTGPGSNLDERIAEAIGAERSHTGRFSHWVLRGNVGGVLVEVAHHPGTTSRRPWTAGSEAIRLASMAIEDHYKLGDTVPQLVIRGHVHQAADSGEVGNRPRAIIHPSWQLNTSFSYRLGATLPLTVGGDAIVCAGGEIEEVRHIHSDWPLENWRPL